MLTEIPPEEMTAALDACAIDVLWEADIQEPPVDSFLVANRLEMVVTHDVAMPHRARFVRLADHDGGGDGQATIVVGVAERPERAQWAVAHEIGESVAYRVFESLGVSPEHQRATAREWVASALASHILLPTRWFAAEGSWADWDLLALKRRFGTASHELIARRMLDMPPAVVMTVCDLGSVNWRRSNVSPFIPPMSEDEREIWCRAHATGQTSTAYLDPEATGLDRIACWAIHELDWKREIIRAEVAEW